MIINCKCGKYQFDVKKSDIGASGREVQCGICNERWMHGESSSATSSKKGNISSSSHTTPFLYKIIIFFIFFTALVGFLDLMKNKLVKAAPLFQDYYIAKEQVILRIITLLQ